MTNQKSTEVAATIAELETIEAKNSFSPLTIGIAVAYRKELTEMAHDVIAKKNVTIPNSSGLYIRDNMGINTTARN